MKRSKSTTTLHRTVSTAREYHRSALRQRDDSRAKSEIAFFLCPPRNGRRHDSFQRDRHRNRSYRVDPLRVSGPSKADRIPTKARNKAHSPKRATQSFKLTKQPTTAINGLHLPSPNSSLGLSLRRERVVLSHRNLYYAFRIDSRSR